MDDEYGFAPKLINYLSPEELQVKEAYEMHYSMVLGVWGEQVF